MNTNLPNDNLIASLLGLERLRVGRHYLRGNGKERIGSIWLDTFWLLNVMPSFSDYGLVGVAVAHGETFHGRETAGWIKAFLETGGSVTVLEIESDPMPHLLANIPLLQRSDSICLDGIGYDLRFATMQISGSIAFANPDALALMAIESTCWEIAERITGSSNDANLSAFVTQWRRYARSS